MKTGEILKAGSVVLPAPSQISVDDEIIWTSDTGRTLSGQMVGDVLAEKKSVKIDWGWLPDKEVALIKSYLTTGFFPVTFHDDGMDITINVYRGTLSKVQKGYIGDGIFWYSNVSVSIVER